MYAKLFLNRSGRFEAKGLNIPPERPYKCGNLDTLEYEYSVSIECDAKRLSPEGFVIENTRVHSYMVDTFGTEGRHWDAISCENMALKAANELCEALVTEGIGIISVIVTFTGSNGAKITAECRPEVQR